MSEPDSQGAPDEAMVDLLIKQITDGLTSDEQRTLDALDSEATSGYARDLQRAAAAVTLAGLGAVAAPPAELRDRLYRDAAAHFAAATPAPAAAANNVVPLKPRAALRSAATGWWAAAACLVLAVIGWQHTPQPQAPPAPEVSLKVPPAVVAPVVPAPPPPTAAEERSTLLAASGAIKVTLGATKDPAGAGVTGDVVWDPVTQKGFLHVAGLAANDPQLRQYQMWIFDGGRDKRYPVDAGVFDVPAGNSEVIVPLHATLPVLTAKAFAVTVEKSGGVVVSGREHVVALGAAG